MKKITIKHHTTANTLWQGTYATIRHALEDALAQKASLAGADLRGQKLDNATLDGADLRGAILDDASLAGTNLSECDLTGASLRGVDLSDACLCESRLIDADLTDAVLSRTLLAHAIIDGCIFTSPTLFTVAFDRVRLGRNIYRTGGQDLPFTAAPIVVTGLAQRLVYLDDHMLAGHTIRPRPQTLPWQETGDNAQTKKRI